MSRWSKERTLVLRGCVTAGLTALDAAFLLDCTPKAAANKARAMGLSLRIADPVWGDARLDLLRLSAESGLSGREAGAALGCSRGAAIAKARRMGWAFASDPQRARAFGVASRQENDVLERAGDEEDPRLLASLERDWRLTA